MLVNIVISKILYEFVKFGEKTVINILRVTTIIWGLALVAVSVFYFLNWEYSEFYAK